MPLTKNKVGLVSCSGEEFPEGTASRIATRLVLEKLKPEETVTICLPLFLAGSEDERTFARVFPTITIDGCEKRCAELGTRKYSGEPAAKVVISDFMKRHPSVNFFSRNEVTEEEMKVINKLAEEIAAKVDELLHQGKR